jgi:glucosamine--fructose-6-phosphate aminotransferase (isomerizing)
LLWIGLAISIAGSQMQIWALLWHVRILTDQPIALGGIGLARILPVIVFSLIGGAVADSANRRTVLFVTQSVMALVALALAWLTFQGQSISQSGETADTLAALQEAKRRGAKLLAVCNVMESSIARLCDGVFYTHAGPEIGVASTKAFTTQLTALFLLALGSAARRQSLTPDEISQQVKALLHLPVALEKVLARAPELERMARKYHHVDDYLYLARGLNFPIALEGALKLKEISYIHAEGYPAGEMKHGPIALIDENMPVVVLAPPDRHLEKITSNFQEVAAREGRLLLFCGPDLVLPEDVEGIDRFIVDVVGEELNPLLYVVPLQLLAYYTAVLKGTDVDQPRNLAKSVTVE